MVLGMGRRMLTWLGMTLCLGGLASATAGARPLGQITTFPLPATSNELWGITPGPGGDLWFSDSSTKSVGRITLQGQITEFPVTDGIHGPSAEITEGPDHNIWFADQQGAVGRTTPQGQTTEYIVGTGSVTDDWVWGVAPGSDGNVWFTNRGCQDNTSGTCAVGKVTPQGQITEYKNFPLSGAVPSDLTAGADGNVWFDDSASAAIGKVTPQGVITEYRINRPGSVLEGITVGPNGNVWFTDAGTRSIGEITPAGHITEFTAGIPQSANLNGIAAGPDGDLWFAVGGKAPAIGRITPQGHVTEYSTGLPKYGFPVSIAPGPDGSMWATVNISPPQFAHDAAVQPGAAIARIGTGFPKPPKPALSGLRVAPKTASIAGRRVAGHCVAPTKKNKRQAHCRRALKLRISYKLSIASKVTLTFARQTSGRLVGKRCSKATKANRRDKRCSRVVKLPGHFTLSGTAGANTFTFKGKLAGRLLGAGAYRVTATPLGGTARTASFRILG
jgi:streptogramin lyase